MPKESLTDARIKGAAAPAAGILELWDSQCSGLCLRVMATGSKTWTIRYRPQGSKTYRRERLGTYPTITLAEARKRGERIRVQVSDGVDPQRQRKEQVEAIRREEVRRALSFGELADFYIERYAKREKASWRNDEGYLRRHAKPAWEDREAHSITKQDAAKLLGDVKEQTPIGANRTRSVLVKLFGWAVDEGLLDTSPMLGVKKPTKERSGRDRTLSDDELRVIWHAIETSTSSPGTKAALMVLALLGQRPGEIAGLSTTELVNAHRPKDARIEFPAERMKARRPHVIPLPPMSLEIIIREVKRNDREGDSVFSSRFANRDRLARHSLSQALRRIIAGLKAEGSNAETVKRLQTDPPTPHDLRRTLATRLAELGIPREDRLAVLAHSWGDVHETHYDKFDRLPQKRAALEAWERHLRALVFVGQSTDDNRKVG